MDDESRRHFLRTCLCLAIAGYGAPLLSLCQGCSDDRRALGPVQPEAHRRKSKLAANIGAGFEPAYLRLHWSGELKRRGESLRERMKKCDLCPRECGAKRLDGQKGFCGSDAQLVVSSYHAHFGEEACLVGRGGSGTVFLTNCSLRCVFCINWEISQGGHGTAVSIDDLAAMMLSLQAKGCHNVNLVTPTHYSPHILLAVDRAAAKGLRVPLVWNTCGWEKVEILKTLDGAVDIYLPDFKYADGPMAEKYSSGATAYPEITKAALTEINRQVDVARAAPDGLLYRGVIIRHFVMPNRVAGTKKIVDWIAANLPKDTYVNIMSQYTPTYRAHDYPEISRRITRQEYEEAVNWARAAGLTSLDILGPRFL
jgi:putative pyruvate formate lyase activating enzyme